MYLSYFGWQNIILFELNKKLKKELKDNMYIKYNNGHSSKTKTTKN